MCRIGLGSVMSQLQRKIRDVSERAPDLLMDEAQSCHAGDLLFASRRCLASHEKSDGAEYWHDIHKQYHAMHTVGTRRREVVRSARNPTAQMAVLQAEPVSTLRLASLPPHVMHGMSIEPQPEYTCALCAAAQKSPYACNHEVTRASGAREGLGEHKPAAERLPANAPSAEACCSFCAPSHESSQSLGSSTPLGMLSMKTTLLSNIGANRIQNAGAAVAGCHP